MIERDIFVKFTVEGWHRWPDAPPHRAYLRSTHRHLFYITASVSVKHNEREVEFHDLLDFCKRAFPSGNYGAASCETLALGLVGEICQAYPGRDVAVGVFEDNEVGALIHYGALDKD